MKEKDHNGIIAFWKFMFCLLIIAFHAGYGYSSAEKLFTGGSIGVEFFFLVSGYLFCKKVIKYEGKDKDIFEDNLKSTWKSIKRFFPFVFILVITSILFARFVLHFRMIDYVYSFYSVLLIPAKTPDIIHLYDVLWYLSVLIVIQFIIFPLLAKYKKNYSSYFAPIISFLLLGYLLIKYKHIVGPWTKDVFTYKSIVRGFMEINLGIFIYEICDRFKNIDFNKFSRFLLTVVEILGYVSIFVLCSRENCHPKFDALMLILLSISILISFSNKSLFTNIFNNKISYYLEKLSLPMYINNWFFVFIVHHSLIGLSYSLPYYLRTVLTIILLMLTGALELFLIQKFDNNKERIEHLFINKK